MTELLSPATLQWHSPGAHLLQSIVAGRPLFYCSPLIGQFTDRPPRGGVPVMFPQFAERGPGPKHGLVRMRSWAAVEGQIDTFSLDVPAQPDQHWTGHARLTVSAQSDDNSLTQHVCVENIGHSAFEFTGGLHPYWALGDATMLRIDGLDSVGFEDRYSAGQALSSAFLTGQAFERLYLQAPTLHVWDGEQSFSLACGGFDNWMVWNPGVELAKGLADLPDDDWTRFVCIEPVVAAMPKLLEPGQRFAAWMKCCVADARQ